MLADSVGTSLDEIADTLARCESAGLVDSCGRPGEFRFLHGLFRTVRLDSLTASWRLQLHHRSQVPEEPPVLALDDARGHTPRLRGSSAWRLGVRVESAMQAGDLLMDQLAIDEAAGLYRLGLSVIDGMEPTPAATQCELLVRLGTALAQNDRVSGLDILFAVARTALDLGRVDIVADATWAMRPINCYSATTQRC